jgi:uracil-DNA glycosylase
MAPKLVQTHLFQKKAVVPNATPAPVPEKGTRVRPREIPELEVSNTSSSALHLASLVVEPGWASALAPLFATRTFAGIEDFLVREYQSGKEIFPAKGDIFAAFNHTPFDDLRVVLLGQDPYHDDGQAHGLCFSVQGAVKPPPSLVNMYKELSTDIPGFKAPSHGNLTSWAKQGILMLNATLTVQAHMANSHAKCGWQSFTEDVVKLINEKKSGIVFLLWGGFAKKKASLINKSKHVVIECAHPSPLSATHWFGCKTFSKCNEALRKLGKQPINWNLPDNA